jgi:putative ABC transport system permease protein
MDEGILSELNAIPGILSTAGQRPLDWTYNGGQIVINAFDPLYFSDHSLGHFAEIDRDHHSEDVWAAIAQGEKVAISRNFELNLGAHVGDSITLQTPTGDLVLEIGAVVVDMVSPRGTIEMSRNVFRKYWNDSQVNRIFVRTSPGYDVVALRALVAQTLGMKHRLRILSSRELVEYFATQVRRAFASIPIIGALVLVVVLVGMADTLAAGVRERTFEFGIIRAVGIRRAEVRHIVLLEAIAIAGFGLILALVCGLSLGLLWVKVNFTYLVGWNLELELPILQILTLVVAAFLVCVAAALLPGLYAARIQPATALRYE